MTYRPPEQALEEPIGSLVRNANQFIAAANKRIESGDWSEKHEDKLTSLIGSLTTIKVELLRLKRTTW